MDKKRGRREIPNWAQRQRYEDLAWIAENFHILYPEARAQFQTRGRGAIVVDTTSQPLPGAGHPFTYYNVEQVEQTGDQDARKMVAEYNPANEMVIMLLKRFNRLSIYRIQEMVIPPPVAQN
jgi:hypothetical protein